MAGDLDAAAERLRATSLAGSTRYARRCGCHHALPREGGRMTSIRSLLTHRVPLLLAFFVAANGCSRAFYRTQADDEVACVVEERAQDPRWEIDDFTIQVDP